MLRILGHSITKKLTRINMLVSGAALLLACLAFGAYDEFTFRQAIVHNLSIQAQIAGSNSVSALLFNDRHEAEKTLSALRAAPNILSAHIYTADGLPFAGYSRDRGGEAPTLPVIPAGQTEAHWFKDGQIVLVRSIIFQAKPTGSVYIQSDLREINDRLKRGTGIAAIVSLTSLLAALLVSSIFQRAVAEPITHLAKIAGVVSRDKDYSVRATPTGSGDELATLIETFNEMLAQIQGRDGALQKAHGELDHRVQERTAELAEANEQLRSEITERKKAEEKLKPVLEALQQSEERLSRLVNGIKDYAILMLDPEGRVTTWNAGAERIKGYRTDEIIGEHFSKFYMPEAVAQDKPSQELKIAAEQGRFEEEGWRVRKDGSRFWANVVITALRDQTGQLRGFGKMTRDITERKKAEEALRGSEERLRMAVEAAEMGTWFWNIQQDEISWSEKFRTLFGLTSNAKLTYKAILQVIHPDDRQRIDRSVKNTLELGVQYDTEYRVVWPDSSVHWIAAKGSARRSPEGVPVEMQGIAMDVTERKEAQEVLKHADIRERRSVELKRSNDELQQFAYIAAHDLQEPLRMVASYTQLLAQRYKGRLDSDADEFIAYAVDGAHRMQLLIADLLAYCRVGTRGKELHETSSEAALEEALLNLQGAIQESGGAVTHDPLPTVVADGAQLVQLFQNVVSNAIKYRSAELPRVHVSAKKNGGKEWIFSMRDNGLGIDPKYFEKIFVMFQRLHGREEFSGTGIGLTVCKKIAERHGGRMWVESEPGKGSTFYFALPERG
jgi:PAS domain S-box-containing protein